MTPDQRVVELWGKWEEVGAYVCKGVEVRVGGWKGRAGEERGWCAMLRSDSMERGH